jgi:hypothetical protein
MKAFLLLFDVLEDIKITDNNKITSLIKALKLELVLSEVIVLQLLGSEVDQLCLRENLRSEEDPLTEGNSAQVSV